MHIYTDINDLPHGAKHHVVVIGNFDGVHRGHMVLINKGCDIAVSLKANLAVLTFEPHPRHIFRPDDRPFRLTPPALKHELLRAAGIDTLYELKFDWDFAGQSAENFIRNILIRGLGAAHIIVGYDFRFGQMRQGTPEMIAHTGLPLTVVDPVKDKADIISSSAIRGAIRRGHIAKANDLLGWQWELRGKVEHGDKRGHDIGYPTANFDLDDTHIHPAYGVYAAHVQIEGEDIWRNAAINIGIRPMFETPKARVESFIFDFDQDIYGKTLRVRPVQFLRSEAKFETVEQLITQIDRDCEKIREILSP
jgi:riboflavin kinase/FMN adenylyltransferase